MTGGRAKGNAFERFLATTLSARFADRTGITTSFRRDPASGAFYGASNARRLETHDRAHATFGDLLTPHQFRFTIEAKAYAASPTLGQMAKQNCALIDRWITQVDHDAANAHRIPALIVKFNHCPVLVMLPEGYNIDPFMRYRDRLVLTLDDWLMMPDDHFFNDSPNLHAV